MHNHITPNSIANQVRMSSQIFRGAHCIVEGQSDIDLYRYFFSAENCRFVHAGGKDRALSAMEALKDTRSAFSILDADFLPITKDQVIPPKVFFTDTHDSETLVIKSEAFKKTLNNFSDLDRLQKFITSLGKDDLRDVLLLSGLQIGYLRLLSETKGYMLNFKTLYIDQFIDSRTLQVDVEGLARELLRLSRRQRLTEQLLLEELRTYSLQQHDPWIIVCGHDLVRLLVSGLKAIFGRDEHRPTQHEIERGLRQAFEAAHFAKTNLYKRIKEWSEDQLGRRILAC